MKELFLDIHLPQDIFGCGSDNSVKRDGFPYRDSIFAQIDILVPFRLYIPAVSEENSSAEPTVRVFFL